MAKFKGSIVECVINFASKTRGNFAFRKKICDHLDIISSTAHVWFDKLIMPVGTNLLKLRLLLELNGYEIVGVNPIDSNIREFGRLIALGIITVEQAKYCLAFNNNHSVLDVVLGKSGVSSKRMQAVTTACAEWHNPMQKKLREWRENLVFEAQPIALPEKPEETPKKITEKTVCTMDHKTALKILANLARAAVPLAEWIASDEFTADERRHLRELSSNGRENNIFSLANTLFLLCSETGRKELV